VRTGRKLMKALGFIEVRTPATTNDAVVLLGSVKELETAKIVHRLELWG